jgi:hypothetical protein
MISSHMMSLAKASSGGESWSFFTRHKGRIIGTITGFDRMLFRSALRCISHYQGMWVFLSSQHVLLKDCGKFVQPRRMRLANMVGPLQRSWDGRINI